MSEAENLEATNGTNGSGDVPEIELIIKGKYTKYTESNFSPTINPINNIMLKDDKDSTTPMGEHTFLLSSVKEETSSRCSSPSYQEFISDSSCSMPETAMSYANLVSETSRCSSSSNQEFISDSSCSMPETAMRYANLVSETLEGLSPIKSTPSKYEQNQDVSFDAVTTSNQRHHVNTGGGISIAMQYGITAVLNDGMSITKAAKKFNLTKSTLWAQLKKLSEYKPPSKHKTKGLPHLIEDKLSSGATLSEVARVLKVSKSTVHMHKTKLCQKGVLSKHQIKRLNRRGAGIRDVSRYENQQKRLANAYDAYKLSGLAVATLAEYYSVPPTSLWRYMNRRKQVENKTKQNDLQEVADDTTKDPKNQLVAAEAIQLNDTEDRCQQFSVTSNDNGVICIDLTDMKFDQNRDSNAAINLNLKYFTILPLADNPTVEQSEITANDDKIIEDGLILENAIMEQLFQ